MIKKTSFVRAELQFQLDSPILHTSESQNLQKECEVLFETINSLEWIEAYQGKTIGIIEKAKFHFRFENSSTQGNAFSIVFLIKVVPKNKSKVSMYEVVAHLATTLVYLANGSGIWTTRNSDNYADLQNISFSNAALQSMRKNLSFTTPKNNNLVSNPGKIRVKSSL
jgi:hypothetical protein